MNAGLWGSRLGDWHDVTNRPAPDKAGEMPDLPAYMAFQQVQRSLAGTAASPSARPRSGALDCAFGIENALAPYGMVSGWWTCATIWL
jgi:hypothetical protein